VAVSARAESGRERFCGSDRVAGAHCCSGEPLQQLIESTTASAVPTGVSPRARSGGGIVGRAGTRRHDRRPTKLERYADGLLDLSSLH
jgi:hypothetical protein